jgi:hypothetical protein
MKDIVHGMEDVALNLQTLNSTLESTIAVVRPREDGQRRQTHILSLYPHLHVQTKSASEMMEPWRRLGAAMRPEKENAASAAPASSP